MRSRARQLGVSVVLVLLLSSGCSGEDDVPVGTDAGPSVDVEQVPGFVLQASGASLSPDGARIVVPCHDRLCMWDGTGTFLTEFGGGPVTAWSPDMTLIATADVDSTGSSVVLLDPETGEEVRRADLAPAGEAESDLTDLAFSPDGALLVAVDGAAVRLLDAASGRERAPLDAAGEDLTEVAFDPTGQRLDVTDLALSPDGRTVAVTTGTGPELLLWPASGGDTEELSGHSSNAGRVFWAPSGRELYSVAPDLVLSWSLETGDEKYSFDRPPFP